MDNRHTFKIGDRVKSADGLVGVVISNYEESPWILWERNADFALRSDHELYGLRAAPPLTPGVRVRILGGIAAGGEGTVIGLNAGNINVRTDDLHTDRAGQFVRHVTVTRKHLIPLHEAA